MRAGNNGVTTNTAHNITFGAGTIHKGLKYDSEKTGWNFTESCIGATKGGSSVKIVPEFYQVDPDGATVALKGFKRKVGEKATMEINLLELTEDIIKAAIVGNSSRIEQIDYTQYYSKPDIDEGDYWENIAFVGETLDGKNIIVILENALCTSGLQIDGKNGEEGVGKYTFECHSEIKTNTQDLTTLPYKIYYPNAASSSAAE